MIVTTFVTENLKFEIERQRSCIHWQLDRITILLYNSGDGSAFIGAVLGLVSQYGLDDVDFEYVIHYIFSTNQYNPKISLSVGNTPTNKALAATRYPPTTQQISSCSSLRCGRRLLQV